MDRYEISVQWITGSQQIELNSAVSQPISITNGRTDLTTSIAQNYASVTFLKSTLDTLLAAESYIADSFSFGSLVVISYIDPATSTAIPLFYGNVSDMGSDAYEITFSLLSNYVYKCNGLFPFTYAGVIDTVSTVVYEVLLQGGGGILMDDTTTASSTDVQIPSAEITNSLAFLAPIVAQAPSNYLFPDPYRDGWVLAERPQPFPAIAITNSEVLRDYSIDRSIDDVTNKVSVNYNPYGGPVATYTRTNTTSVGKIGTRFTELTTQIVDFEIDAERLATWYLGAHAPAGFPLITFRTSAELLETVGFSPTDIATDLQPNRVLDLTAVNATGFDDYAYIEQIRHTIDRSVWRIEIIASNASYSDLPQTWSQVTPSLLWDDVLNDPPNVVTWDDLLYTNL